MTNKIELKGVRSVYEGVDGFGSYGRHYNAVRTLNSGTEKEAFVALYLSNNEYIKPKDSSDKQDPSGKDTFDCIFGFAPNEHSAPNKEIFKIENLKVKNIERGEDEFIPNHRGLTSSYIVVIDPEQNLEDIKVEFFNTDYLNSFMNNYSYLSSLLGE